MAAERGARSLEGKTSFASETHSAARRFGWVLVLLWCLLLPRSIARAELDEDEGGPPRADTADPAPHDSPTARPDFERRSRSAYVVAVSAQPDLFIDLQHAGTAARVALQGMDDVQWQGADRAFWGRGEAALEALERARMRLDAGRTAYLNLDFTGAIQQLSTAVADFDAAQSVLDDPQDLAQALLYEGASLVIEGRLRDAQRVFSRVHVQMPDIHPDPNVFNPDIVARFEAAQPRVARRAGAIRVESDPPGAVVHVDFQLRGATPIDVSQLPAGEHVVRVIRFGAMPLVQRVTVQALATERVAAHFIPEATMENLPDWLVQLGAIDVESEEARNVIERLAASLDVETLGLLRLSAATTHEQVNLEFVLFDASGRRLARDGRAVPRVRGDLEREVTQLVDGVFQVGLRSHLDRPDQPQAGPADASLDSAEPSLAEQWWFWALLGGAAIVVGASIGIGVGLAEQPSEPRGHVMLEF